MKNKLIILLFSINILIGIYDIGIIMCIKNDVTYIPETKQNISDEYHYISEEFEKVLLTNIMSVKRDVDIYTVIVDSTKQLSLKKYSQKIINAWNLSDNTILIVLSTKTNDVQIIIGKNVNITKEQVDYIVNNYMSPYFLLDDYEDGLVVGITQLIKLITIK
jgi:uncharacterized membrane protein YgcG